MKGLIVNFVEDEETSRLVSSWLVPVSGSVKGLRMSGTGYPNPPPLPPTPLPPYMASSPLRSPRDSPRSSPRTPRTNRAAEVRIQR